MMYSTTARKSITLVCSEGKRMTLKFGYLGGILLKIKFIFVEKS
jgi:hypothetical protein